MWLYFRLFLLGLRLLRRDRRDLVLENLVLRQQLAVRSVNVYVFDARLVGEVGGDVVYGINVAKVEGVVQNILDRRDQGQRSIFRLIDEDRPLTPNVQPGDRADRQCDHGHQRHGQGQHDAEAGALYQQPSIHRHSPPDASDDSALKPPLRVRLPAG